MLWTGRSFGSTEIKIHAKMLTYLFLGCFPSLKWLHYRLPSKSMCCRLGELFTYDKLACVSNIGIDAAMLLGASTSLFSTPNGLLLAWTMETAVAGSMVSRSKGVYPEISNLYDETLSCKA